MPTPPKKKRQTSQATWIATAVVVIVVIGVGYWLFARRAAASEYNHIVTTMINADPPKDQEASAALEALLKKELPEDISNEARHELAKCYIRLGDKDEFSMKQRAEWFKKAQRVDPSALEDVHRKEIELADQPLPEDEPE